MDKVKANSLLKNVVRVVTHFHWELRNCDYKTKLKIDKTSFK